MTSTDHGTSQLSDSSRLGGVANGHPSQAVWWLIGISLAIIAFCLLTKVDTTAGSRVFAQQPTSAGSHGVFAFSGQLAKDAYGLFMVDVDAGTIWCYRYDANKNILKFVAARDWRYDRYLKDFSTEPTTDFIRQQLEQQRAAEMQSNTR